MPKPEPKIVWVNCRATLGCGGTQALIVHRFKKPGGGKSIRYKCMKCNRNYHISL
jgi:ribosomal protein L44E